MNQSDIINDFVTPVLTAVAKAVTDKISATPQSAFFLILSYLSGHLWVFMVDTYRPKLNGFDFLKEKLGKISLGIMWNLSVVSLVYTSRFHVYFFEYEKVSDCLVSTIIFGFTLQFIILVICITYGERK